MINITCQLFEMGDISAEMHDFKMNFNETKQILYKASIS